MNTTAIKNEALNVFGAEWVLEVSTSYVYSEETIVFVCRGAHRLDEIVNVRGKNSSERAIAIALKLDVSDFYRFFNSGRVCLSQCDLNRIRALQVELDRRITKQSTKVG